LRWRRRRRKIKDMEQVKALLILRHKLDGPEEWNERKEGNDDSSTSCLVLLLLACLTAWLKQRSNISLFSCCLTEPEEAQIWFEKKKEPEKGNNFLRFLHKFGDNLEEKEQEKRE